MKNKKVSFNFSFPKISINTSRLGTFKIPTLTNVRIPFPTNIYLSGSKLIIGSLSTVVLGFIAATFVFINTGNAEIVYPQPGQYIVPSKVGQAMIDPEFPADKSQTLQLNIPPGTRLNKVTFKNVSLGKSGLTTAFQINGTSTAYIVVDELIIKNSEFPSMDFANASFFKVNATSSVEAAGHTFSPTVTTTLSDFTIGSVRGAADYVAEDMVVDRIIIQASAGGADILISQLVLDGVKASVGNFDLDYAKAGMLEMSGLRVGDDGDINSADLVINTSVNVTSVQDGVVESAIYIR